MEEIGARLQRLRKLKQWTQATLAQKAGVTQGTIGNLESGLREYGKSVVDIARALEVTPEYLRCESNATAPAAPAPGSTNLQEARTKRLFPMIDFEKLTRLSERGLGHIERAMLDAARELGEDIRSGESAAESEKPQRARKKG